MTAPPSGVLPDWAIAELAAHGMIRPFVAELIRPAGPSYGLGSCGYDIRLAPTLLVVRGNGIALDTRAPNPKAFTPVDGPRLAIPPHGFALGHSLETFAMPPDVLGLAVGKSTLARLGIHVLLTPLEPGWRGVLTIEIANLTPNPAIVHAGDGIAQIVFVRIPAPLVTYADRRGIYQDQTGITPARVAPPHHPSRTPRRPRS